MHEIPFFPPGIELENEMEKDLYMSLEERYTCHKQRLEETNKITNEKYWHLAEKVEER